MSMRYRLTIRQSVCKILRSMAMKSVYTTGLSYKDFKDRLNWRTSTRANELC